MNRFPNKEQMEEYSDKLTVVVTPAAHGTRQTKSKKHHKFNITIDDDDNKKKKIKKIIEENDKAEKKEYDEQQSHYSPIFAKAYEQSLQDNSADVSTAWENSIHAFLKNNGLDNGPSINSPVPFFNEEKNLKNATSHDSCGLLEKLLGTWVSYIGPEHAQRLDKQPITDPLEKSIGSGIVTTLMPSPGTTRDEIPGKMRFVCDEYVEVLRFEKVPGGVRNRGGIVEQFNGTIKYEQQIQSITSSGRLNREELALLEKIKAEFHPLPDDYDGYAKNNVQPPNTQPTSPLEQEYDNQIAAIKEKIASDKNPNDPTAIDIHYENGLYLWLNQIYAHPPTDKSIRTDRGVYPDSNGIFPQDSVLSDNNVVGGDKYPGILPHKELKVLDAKDYRGPHYIPGHSISRSGSIPHGSALTAIGGFLAPRFGQPVFVSPTVDPKTKETKFNPYNRHDEDHLSMHPTMGGRGIANLYIGDRAPKWTNNLRHIFDQFENRMYISPILRHRLFPYSVRPDLRLFHVLQNQKVYDHVQIILETEQSVGPQGGVVNTPFIDRFTPVVRVIFNLWLELVEKDYDDNEDQDEGSSIVGGKTVKLIPQLQYEQIVFFEFGHGDDGTITRWPHIQVNTLRRFEDLSKEQQENMASLFSLSDKDKIVPDAATSPIIKKHTDDNSSATESACPFSGKKKTGLCPYAKK